MAPQMRPCCWNSAKRTMPISTGLVIARLPQKTSCELNKSSARYASEPFTFPNEAGQCERYLMSKFKTVLVAIGVMALVSPIGTTQTECWGANCNDAFDDFNQSYDSLSRESQLFYDQSQREAELMFWDGSRRDRDRTQCQIGCDIGYQSRLLKCEITRDNDYMSEPSFKQLSFENCQGSAELWFLMCLRKCLPSNGY